jgi:hypothetical protein
VKTYNYNGEFWYCDRRPLWLRLRQWLIWFGMWEDPRRSGRGLRPLRGADERHRRGWLRDPTPVSILGHRATFFGWGIQVRLGRSWFVWCFRRFGERWRGKAYVSRDGTSARAHLWFWGEPHEVRKAVVEHEREIRERDRHLGIVA